MTEYPDSVSQNSLTRCSESRCCPRDHKIVVLFLVTLCMFDYAAGEIDAFAVLLMGVFVMFDRFIDLSGS